MQSFPLAELTWTSSLRKVWHPVAGIQDSQLLPCRHLIEGRLLQIQLTFAGVLAYILAYQFERQYRGESSYLIRVGFQIQLHGR